jgi:hypothetical protein
MTTTGVPHRDFFCVGNVRFTSTPVISDGRIL